VATPAVTANTGTVINAGSPTSVTITLNATAMTPLSTVMLLIGSPSTTATYTISDNTGLNTWGSFVNRNIATNQQVYLFAVQNNSNTNSFVITISISPGSSIWGTAFEATGILSTQDVSGNFTNNTGGTTSWGPCVTNSSTTVPNELVVTGFMTNTAETFSSFAPYTQVGSGATRLFAGYNIISSTGTQSATVHGTVNSTCAAIIDTYAAAVTIPVPLIFNRRNVLYFT
jgi:hypothetical protein